MLRVSQVTYELTHVFRALVRTNCAPTAERLGEMYILAVGVYTPHARMCSASIVLRFLAISLRAFVSSSNVVIDVSLC